MSTPIPVPTQVRRPWRATARTVFQALVSFAALAPFIAAAVEEATGYDLDGVPFIVTALLACAAFTRVMALPAVEAFLQRFVPFLAATPRHILGKALAGDLPPAVEKPGGMRARDYGNDVPHRH
jgi:hypothetical protein